MYPTYYQRPTLKLKIEILNFPILQTVIHEYIKKNYQLINILFKIS